MTIAEHERDSLLSAASQLILTADPEELRVVWEITERFLIARQALLGAEQQKSPTFFLRLALNLRETLSDSTNGALRNNALVSLALAISLGLDDDERREAFDGLFSPPLAGPETFTLFCKKVGRGLSEEER